jgi:hypothetical protein
VFGEVLRGKNIVRELESQETAEEDKPLKVNNQQQCCHCGYLSFLMISVHLNTTRCLYHPGIQVSVCFHCRRWQESPGNFVAQEEMCVFLMGIWQPELAVGELSTEFGSKRVDLKRTPYQLSRKLPYFNGC